MAARADHGASVGNWSDNLASNFNNTADLVFSAAIWTRSGSYLGSGTSGAVRTVRSMTYNDNWGAASGAIRFNSNNSSGGTALPNHLRLNSSTGTSTVTLTSGMSGSVIWGTDGNSVYGELQLGTNTVFDFQGSGTLNVNAPITEVTAGKTVTKQGPGTLIFSKAASYTGTTAINGGTLRINGTHTGGGTYTVAAAGTLQGSGSTSSQLDVSGVLSPGASVQSFGSGTLNLFGGSTFEYETNSSVATTSGADLQVVSGNLNLTGPVALTLADLASLPTAFSGGTTFSLINYSGAWNSGLFSFGGDEIADGGTFIAGLNTWQIDYDAASGGPNFTGDQMLTSSFVNLTAIVPEPSAALLGGLGLLALSRRRRR